MSECIFSALLGFPDLTAEITPSFSRNVSFCRFREITQIRGFGHFFVSEVSKKPLLSDGSKTPKCRNNTVLLFGPGFCAVKHGKSRKMTIFIHFRRSCKVYLGRGQKRPFSDAENCSRKCYFSSKIVNF